MRTHRDLDVWKNGIELVKKIYAVTSDFPKEEIYGLTSQIRRSVVSIPSNIAEGSARNGTREFIQFLYIALGSVAELETQLIISKELGYLKDLSVFEDLEKIKVQLINLIKSLKKKSEEARQ
ncbi:MAG: four helix bundle protein [Sulfurihydrogenibium sp.]|nr:four helix bundle protein [Sulfurihydrogenibium sp.]